MEDIKEEIDKVIQDLENKGVNPSELNGLTEQQAIGLGDIVENTLTKFGITQERYKQWFNLEECNCTKRKQWLNTLFSWNVKE